MNSKHNACIDCPASLACMAMDRPFEGGKFEEQGISTCTQFYCPQCFRPWVVHSFRHREAKRLDWSRAPRAKIRNSGEMCDQCTEVNQWIYQVTNFKAELQQRESMKRNKGAYVMGVDLGSTAQSAVCIMSPTDTSTYAGGANYQQYIVSGDIANSVVEQKMSFVELIDSMETAAKKKRALQKLQKSRRRSNIAEYWGGRKP